MRRWFAAVSLSLIWSTVLANGQVRTADEVPAALQGTWGKNGRCDIASDRLTITSNTAGWDGGYSGAVGYSAPERAVTWNQEYEVDNFVPGGSPDVLVHNTQGFGMPGQEGYARCGAERTRVPWPPKPAGGR